MADGSRIDREAEGVLPGGAESMYLKASSGLILAAGPVLGLIFAVFLPFIGIAMAVQMAVVKIASGLKEAAGTSTAFAWRPIEAYLAGRKHRKAAREKKTEKKN